LACLWLGKLKTSAFLAQARSPFCFKGWFDESAKDDGLFTGDDGLFT